MDSFCKLRDSIVAPLNDVLVGQTAPNSLNDANDTESSDEKHGGIYHI